MRDQIIRYLQGMKCEWFPVEWDSYFVEWLATEIEFYDISGIKMRYFFEGKECNIQYVRNMDSENVTFTHFSHYGTLDRCKTLLLNAVRSVDEPKRRAAGQVYAKYIVGVNEAWMRVFCQSRHGGKYDIVWQNGEFK